MKTAKEVSDLIQKLKNDGIPLSEVAWKAALACVGWSYVYSAWGAECTPAERRKRYKMCPSHETIKTKCKGFENGNCSGCKWFPNGERTLCFDCRGFTDWCLKQIGFDLYGDTCSAQWNHGANWKAKGEIANMPKDTLCCLFVYKGGKWTHTGLGFNNETIECSNGVQYSSKRASKWTHWAVPACVDTAVFPSVPADDKSSDSSLPMLKKGMKGEYVSLLQSKLVSKGYSVGSYGIDGDFGKATEAAVKQFQTDNGLKADGIVGAKTWDALDKVQDTKLYTVHIPFLTKLKAEAIIAQYSGSWMTNE